MPAPPWRPCSPCRPGTEVGIDVIAPVERSRLHATVPGLGFADEVPREAVRRVITGVAARCQNLPAIQLRLRRQNVDREGVSLDAVGDRGLAAIRRAIRSGIAVAGLPVPGADDEEFLPHVSIGYAIAIGPTEPMSVAFAAAEFPPVTMSVSRLTLLALRVRQSGHDWDVLGHAALADG